MLNIKYKKERLQITKEDCSIKINEQSVFTFNNNNISFISSNTFALTSHLIPGYFDKIQLFIRGEIDDNNTTTVSMEFETEEERNEFLHDTRK